MRCATLVLGCVYAGVCSAAPLAMTDQVKIGLSMWGKMELQFETQNREPNEQEQLQDQPWVNKDKFQKPVTTKEHICVLTSYSRGCKRMKELTSQNKMDYAKKWGYSFRVYTEENSMMANPHEDKFALILKELESGCDWVYWTDSDSFFSNFDIPLAAFTEKETADFIMSWMTFDTQGLKDQIPWIVKMKDRPLDDRRYHQLNSGQFFVRNTPFAKKFLKDAWKNTQTKRKIITAWNDQGNIADLILQQDAASVKKFSFYSFRAFNSHFALEQAAGQGSNSQDLVIHNPGSCRTTTFYHQLCYAMLMYKAPSTPRRLAMECSKSITARDRMTAAHFHPSEMAAEVQFKVQRAP